MPISSGVQKLLQEYQLWQREIGAGGEGNTISVDEVAARVASFYEKIRGIVDWREEHLLRKTAIERILKRRLFLNKDMEDFAERFLSELVRGGHFPNDRIPLEKVDEIQNIIEKYVFILGQHDASREKANSKMENWMLSIAAVEIEEALSQPRRERALINLMADDLRARVEIVDSKKIHIDITENEKAVQIFVAVQKALFKLDNSTITYHLLERFYPDWKNPAKETLSRISSNLLDLYEQINKILFHPYSEKFYQLAETYDTPYLIVGDIITEDPDHFAEIMENSSDFEEAIRHAYNRRHSRLTGRIRRAAFYSTLSVFLTKVLIGFGIEIPLEQYLGNEINLVPLGLSIATPPLLMLLLVMSAQTTSQQNFERVMVEVMKISRASDRRDTYKINPLRSKSGPIVVSVYALYFFTFIISFGTLIWILQKLNFNIFSTVIFLMFVSLVAFAGTKIRQRARELMVEREKDGLLHNIFDVFSLPMIQVGKWLSGQFIKYNVLVIIFNFLIEVPFQIFVEFIEQWRNFLREKKDEIH